MTRTLIRRVSPWRRIAAFGVDYLMIAAYIGLLVLFMLSVGGGLVAWVRAPWQGQLLGFVTLTLPVVLYFSMSEASGAQGTLGKRMVGLCVVTGFGERVSFPRTLLRAAVKFLPWELSHAVLHRIEGWPQEPELLSAGQLVAVGMAYLLVLWFGLSLFLGNRRTLYDRLAGTRVVRALRSAHPTRLLEVAP